MQLNPLANDFTNILSVVLALMVTLTIHEAAHALVANYFGDPTARLAGRLSLNPFAHLDPLGTLLLFVAGFGWGKPVPVNPIHFHNPRRDEMLVAVAGPIANLLLAVLLGITLRFTLDRLSPALFSLLTILAFYNISLAIFNLIPVPPLDGSKILFFVVPYRVREVLEQYSLIILIGLVLAIQFNLPLVNPIIFGSATRLFRWFTGIPMPI